MSPTFDPDFSPPALDLLLLLGDEGVAGRAGSVLPPPPAEADPGVESIFGAPDWVPGVATAEAEGEGLGLASGLTLRLLFLDGLVVGGSGCA